jgi:phage tail-like protein
MSADNKFTDPYAGYRFKVKFGGEYVAGVSEVSGIKSKTAVKAMREGGNNLYERWMIEQHSFPEMLSLKKLFFDKANPFYGWVTGIHGSSFPGRKTVIVELLDAEGKNTVGTYTFQNCFPAEFEGPSFNAKGGEISVESVKIRYDYFEYKAS